MIYISGYIVINWLTRLYITNIMQFLPRKKTDLYYNIKHFAKVTTGYG